MPSLQVIELESPLNGHGILVVALESLVFLCHNASPSAFGISAGKPKLRKQLKIRSPVHLFRHHRLCLLIFLAIGRVGAPAATGFQTTDAIFAQQNQGGSFFDPSAVSPAKKIFKKSAKWFLRNNRVFLPCVIIGGCMLNAYDRAAGRPVTGGWIALVRSGQSARGLAHAQTLRVSGACGERASVLECGGPTSRTTPRRSHVRPCSFMLSLWSLSSVFVHPVHPVNLVHMMPLSRHGKNYPVAQVALVRQAPIHAHSNLHVHS